MAKQFVDVGPNSNFAATKQSGAALTLTNTVRILYDDTASTKNLAAALEIATRRILQLESD